MSGAYRTLPPIDEKERDRIIALAKPPHDLAVSTIATRMGRGMMTIAKILDDAGVPRPKRNRRIYRS